MMTRHLFARARNRWALAFRAGLLACGILTGSLAQAAPAASKLDDRGSEEDQRACTPDVFRLCTSEIPNEPRIVACLIRSKPQLSPACRAVFDRASRTTQTAKARSPRRAASHRATVRTSSRHSRAKTTRVSRRDVR